MTPRACIITFGCQMNAHDSHRMMAILRGQGYESTELPEEADLILLNTCSVRYNPENKVYSELGRLRALRESRPGLIIGVTGCVAQQEGTRLLKRERAVDLVFGPDHYFSLPELLARVRLGERVAVTDQHIRNAEHVDNFIPDEWLEAGHLEGCVASVAIMKGCDNYCAYCVVPTTRGREVSREPENVLSEIKALVAQGAREVWLLGQNVNSYRAGGWDFHALIDAVSRIEGLARVRFTSSHPKDWDARLAALMASRPAICKQLHLPFQAGSDRVLALMNRRHTIAAYLEKIAYARAAVPGIVFSTDLIVGFPTETDAEFEETMRVLEEVRFSLVFSFMYSPRPGTQAALMPDDVHREVKNERLQRVIALQERITREQMDALTGALEEVLVENAHSRRSGVMNGRTSSYRPVSITGEGLEVGDLVQARITGNRGHWLEGVVAK